MQKENISFVEIFSARLKEALKGHKQKDVSRELGVGQPNLSMYANGGSKPALDVFRSLCVHLGVSADWMLGISADRNMSGNATTTNRSAAATGDARATGTSSPDTDRLLRIIESQQKVIADLVAGSRKPRPRPAKSEK